MSEMNAEDVRHLCAKVLKYVKSFDDGNSESEKKVLELFTILTNVKVTEKLLADTGAAKQLKKIKSHKTESFSKAAKVLIDTWKNTIRQEIDAKPLQNVQTSEDKPEKNLSVKTAKSDAAEDPATTVISPKLQAFGSYKQSDDPTRQKISVLLGEALSKADSGADNVGNPAYIGVAIENELFKKYKDVNKDYKQKFRSLSFNLKDPKNPDLRRKVLSGEIEPHIFVTLTAEELASDDKRSENSDIRKRAEAEAVRGQQKQASTDQFQCGKCKQRKCTYYQLQTRSADEPMTTFVTCVNCDNRWKFC